MSEDRAGTGRITEDSQKQASESRGQTIYEMIEEASYLTLENNSPELLGYVTELVNAGQSPEEIVDTIMKKTGLPRWRVAYLGCAGAYIQKLNSVAVSGKVA